MFSRARYIAQVWCRANVDRELVVGHRWPVAAQHFAHATRGAVDAGDFVAKKARPGKLREAAQIDMHLVVAVVAGDVTRQHARVGRMRIAANDGETHARHRLHAETFDDTDVAMAAADKHDVAQDRLIRGLQGREGRGAVRGTGRKQGGECGNMRAFAHTVCQP